MAIAKEQRIGNSDREMNPTFYNVMQMFFKKLNLYVLTRKGMRGTR